MSTNISNLAWDTRVTRENFDLDKEHQHVKIFYKTGTLSSPGAPGSGGKKLKTESDEVKLADLGPMNDNWHLLAKEIIPRIQDSTRGEHFVADYKALLGNFDYTALVSEQGGDDQQREAIKVKTEKVLSSWFPITLWKADGAKAAKVNPETLGNMPSFVWTVSAALANLGDVYVDLEGSKEALEEFSLEYAKLWQTLLLEAAEHSASVKGLIPMPEDETPTRYKYDVKSRFCIIPQGHGIRPLKLFILVAPDVVHRLQGDGLKAACKQAADACQTGDGPLLAGIPAVLMQEFQNEPPQTYQQPFPQCRFILMDAAGKGTYDNNKTDQAQDLICISTHPLGFYTTYVRRGDLGALVDLQDGVANGQQGTWMRPLPQGDEVAELNEGLLTKLSGTIFRKKMSRVSKTTTTTAELTPDAPLDIKARQQTQAIMGGSANKWARTVGWNEPAGARVTVAEWLHRAAHRFGGTGADLYPNLIFGSKECNTHMIRAENLVNDVLNHGDKVASVKVVTIVEDKAQVSMLGRDGNPHDIDVPWHNVFENVQHYYYWIAAEMKYRITVTFNNDLHREPLEGETIFQPFHRYIPLRYEVELDKAILDSYFKSL